MLCCELWEPWRVDSLGGDEPKRRGEWFKGWAVALCGQLAVQEEGPLRLRVGCGLEAGQELIKAIEAQRLVMRHNEG